MMLECDEAVAPFGRSVTALQAAARCASGLRSRLAASTALALTLTAAPAWAQALPTGGSVAAGAASIARPNASTLNVNQSTNHAIINWNTFSVGAGDTVNFNQPGATSSTLNRVNGSTPSSIAGAINAPGTVLLVNPNGIEITKSGVINTGSFAASTLGISDSDYLSGRYSFNGNGGSAAVINSGRINVSDGGFAALLGGQVANNGVISARLGSVALGAGEQATLDLSGDGFLSVAVPSSELGKLVDANGALVSNKGKIVASGGTVYLSAATAANVLRNAVNIPGSVRANTVGSHNGRIVINGGDGGSVNVSGRLAANGGKTHRAGSVSVSGASVRVSGKLSANGSTGGAVSIVGTGSVAITGKLAANGATARGGQVDVTGANVMLNGATIDALGATGGGDVNLGGGPHATVALADAQSLLIDSATTIDASATGAGNGGHIVAWSDGLTTATGALNAKGGPNGGAGGSIETSGQTVTFDGVRVDTSAANGAAGLWLVDPENLTIDAGSAATISGNLANNDVILETTSTNASGTGVVTAGGLGDIVIDSGISWSSAHTLTLDSYNAIDVDAAITINGAGKLTLDYNTTSPTNLSFAQGAAVTYAVGSGDGIAGQALTINGTPYTLLYSMSDLANINGGSGSDALALSLVASTPYTSAVVGSFSGTFEGLGNTISDLTITGTSDNAGLFGTLNAGVLRDIGVVGGSVSGGNNVGDLVGWVGDATIISSYTTGAVSGTYSSGVGGLAGSIGDFRGTITSSYATGTVSGSQDTDVGGLVGANGGTVTSSYATGAVSGSSSVGGLVGLSYQIGGGGIASSYATGAVSGGSNVGGLVGTNNATTASSYATGTVSGGAFSAALGGLVGENTSGTITSSYATGAVSGGEAAYSIGGLVGDSSFGATITSSYATGAVSGGASSNYVGGLVGSNGDYEGLSDTITSSYATGRVSGGGGGGLVGWNQVGGTIASSAFDTQTTGQSSGIGQDDSGTQGANIAGLTTRQFQGLDPISGSIYFSTTTNLGDTSGVFAGGTGGLYPYLKAFFANGVQAISGTAYSDAGATTLASGGNGAVTVSVDGNGAAFGSAKTGANGYYYVFAPANTLAGGSSVLAYTTANSATGATNAATLVTSAGTAAQSGVNVYANTLSVATSATTLSAAPSLALAETDAAAVAGSDANALAALNGATGRGLLATGASFTIDQPITTANAFLVQTSPSAPLTVAQPIIISGLSSLGLLSGGSLTVNAPINVTGAGSVNLNAAYDTTTVFATSLLELSFGQGASLSYTGTPNTGQALTINGQAYTLLYKLADGTTGVPDSGTDDIAGIDASGDAGHYALATNLIGTATFSAPLASESMSNDFTGVFEGLGHTITNLTINDPTAWDDVGLFGRNSGVIRDIGLVGGAVTGSGADSDVGGLVGINYAGAIANSYATDAVKGGTSGIAGGLVGTNQGSSPNIFVNPYATIVNSYATGAVTGQYYAGGLVGLNQGVSGPATISNSYATGAVSGGTYAGGLVGGNSVGYAGNATIADSFATGAVSGYDVGGLVATNSASVGAITNSYWDISTTGRTNDGARASASTAPGSINGYNPSTGSIGLTTAQLQSGVASFTGSAFAGGSGGLYPYLESFFPNGVQAISGIAYSDAGGTPLASGTNGAVTVSIDGNGAAFGSATTGANGYYYVFAPADTLAAGSSVLAYTTANSATGATNAATLVTSAGAAAQTGVNVYGRTLSVATSATTLSAAPSLALVETDAAAAAGSDANAQAALSGATGRGILATGASFTIDQPISTANTFLVQTSAGAPLTVAQPITISGFGGLGLLSGGSLAVDAPINVTGAGSVDLAAAYDTTTVPGTSLLELAFAQGASLSYTGVPNAGQALKINGQAYTLLYNLGDGTTGLPDHGTDDIAGIDASGDAGHYALADNLIGTAAFSTALAGAGTNVFEGVFEGLGHTITNLTINDPASLYVGLFGRSIGVIRDIGLVGGEVSGDSIVGGLVGVDYGAIVSSYATDAVGGGTYVGGLVGANVGELGTAAIVNSYAAGAVIGGQSSDVGGLVGLNEGALAAATIFDSYATGAVSSGDYAGGLVGKIYAVGGAATIANSFATGAVSGPNARGLVALNNAGVGAVTNSYWDVLTTGRTNDGAQAAATGSVNGYNPSTGSIGLTTAQLQSGVASFTGSAFAGGAGGLYPYLASFFPNGVQAITGTAQTTGGAALSAAQVAIYSGGAEFGGAVSSGANGYFYDIVAAGTLAASGVEIGATVTPSGGHAATGLVYTDAGTVTNDLLPLGALTAGFDQQTTAATTYSALQTDLDAAFGATTYSGLTTALATTPLRIIATGASFTLDQAVSEQAAFNLTTTGANAPITISAALDATGQTVTLIAAGAISETAGAVSAGRLTGAASGLVSLTAAANAVGALGSFTVGNGAFTLQDSAALTVDGAVNAGAGATVLNSVGSLTIASGASVTGGSVTLATSDAFVNNAGSGAVIASNGRWLIYSDAPTGDTFGNLNSNNTAIWDATYGSSPPASIAAGGDRYVFAYQPTLSFTSTSVSKSYGVDDTAALASAYSVSGLQSGVSGAFLGDSASVYSGAPSVTSAGASAGASVAGGPYTINVAQGALRSLTGYAFAFVSSGQLTVNPETLPYEDPPSQYLISTNAPPATDSVTICFDFQDVNASSPPSHSHPTRRGRWRRLKRTAT